METTFITIQDLTSEARILYSSDSIVDLLGYTPEEVLNKSSWEFFHPKELERALEVHNDTVSLDKAAVLAYCRLKHKNGHWECCECSFTVCYDVIVGCVSIYHATSANSNRADDAPTVQRMFSASPKDPRYSMLDHLSAKFTQDAKDQTPEPRAAMFLNRFTQTLTVMYATQGTEDILGITGEELHGRSFYHCIQENCLADAIKCIESAKSNDSIAYLRFWYRDPRNNEGVAASTAGESVDTDMTDAASEDEDDRDSASRSNSAVLSNFSRRSAPDSRPRIILPDNHDTARPVQRFHDQPLCSSMARIMQETSNDSGVSSGNSLLPPNTRSAIFGDSSNTSTSASSAPPSRASSGGRSATSGLLELEAVVSCTSDGLVVCLRRAYPLTNPATQSTPLPQSGYPNGLFAVPWATEQNRMPPPPRPQPIRVAPPPRLNTIAVPHQPAPNYELEIEPTPADFMASIREVAAFAWALTGINGTVLHYSRGRSTGQSQPAEGVPIWRKDTIPRLRSTGEGSSSSLSRSRSSGDSDLRARSQGTSATSPSLQRSNYGDNSERDISPLVQKRRNSLREGRYPFGDPGL